MANIFDKMPIPKGSRGVFNLSKMHTSTMDFFRWDVAHCMPLVPNDVVNLNIHSYIQGAPNPFPINGKMRCGLYAFYVPTRIVWENWKYYINDLQSGLTMPYFTVGDLYTALNSSTFTSLLKNDAKRFVGNIMNLGSLMQFMDSNTYAAVTNIPSEIRNLKLSAIPLRCVQRIWFDWMRDKAHISDNALSSYCLTSGGQISSAELLSLVTPKYRCYSKNYITTAFDTPSEINSITPNGGRNTSGYLSVSDSHQPQPFNITAYTSTGSSVSGGVNISSPGSPSPDSSGNRISGHYIQDLRSANSLQHLGERLLVAGKTVLSRTMALFGTSPTIEELQMSDYLGGHEEDLHFNTENAPVTTSPQAGQQVLQVGSFGFDPEFNTIQGQKGQTISSGSNGCGLENVTYKTDEHGYLFVMSCITPIPAYYQGLERDWTRGLDTFASDKYDFFFEDFENEGLQPVLNYEVCFSGLGDAKYSPKGVFGFQQKYIDYKYAHDSLGGDFIMPYTKVTMECMHLGRDIQGVVEGLAGSSYTVNQFLTPEVLTQSTEADKQEFDDKFTITSGGFDHFIVNHKIACVASRPMQQNALPALSASESRNTGKNLVETSGFRL